MLVPTLSLLILSVLLSSTPPLHPLLMDSHLIYLPPFVAPVLDVEILHCTTQQYAPFELSVIHTHSQATDHLLSRA